MRRRINPTFCVVFATYLFLSSIHPIESKMPGAVDAVIVTLQNFALLPGIFPITPIITVAWSLSYEMSFYLAVPATIMPLDMRERSSQWRMRFIVVVATAIALYCAGFGGPLRLIMFLTGMLLHEVLRSATSAPSRNGVAFFALAGRLLATAVPLSFPGTGAFKLLILAAGSSSPAIAASAVRVPRSYGYSPRPH